MKEKKRKLDDVKTEFQNEILNGVKILNSIITDFINDKMDKEKLQQVIDSEKHCDRLKEEYINLLFKKKRALPFIVEDRYKMITSLDDGIMDKIEEILGDTNISNIELSGRSIKEISITYGYCKDFLDTLRAFFDELYKRMKPGSFL